MNSTPYSYSVWLALNYVYEYDFIPNVRLMISDLLIRAPRILYVPSILSRLSIPKI